MITFFVNDKKIEAEEGEYLLSILIKNNISIKANCEGNGACGTCQVILDKEHYDKLEITDEEYDVLEKQTNLTPTSRLACQLLITKDFEGAKITLL